MGTKQQQDQMTQPAMNMFERNELKFLNIALIFYLSFGAFLFDSLGDFRPKLSLNLGPNDVGTKRDDDSSLRLKGDLNGLRLDSVRRMWNITNKLNILYESNWTKLILEELIEFEQHFLESLTNKENSFESEDFEDINSSDSDSKSTSKSKDSEINKQNEQQQQQRYKTQRAKSIKKSLVHSLATITTMGSPQGLPQSQMGKLATILYGALGIPLLFHTLTKTGKQMATSATNTLLTLNHYLFKLPAHYLCCSCDLLDCFRWLIWCCCCCCCSYLCCLTRRKTKCCDSRGAPKLKLLQKSKRQPRDGATSSTNSNMDPYLMEREMLNNAHQVAKVHEPNDKCPPSSKQQTDNQHYQKTVRFVNQQQQGFQQQQNNLPFGCKSKAEAEEKDRDGDGDEDEELSIYSLSLFLTSLLVLAIYLAIGAYFYARNQPDMTLVDALYVCYSLLSTSKLPESMGSSSSLKDTLLANYKRQEPNASKAMATLEQQPVRATSTEALFWQLIYLLIGLNLVSMCSHFAQLWLQNKRKRKDVNCKMGQTQQVGKDDAHCNGHLPSVMNSLDNCNNILGQPSSTLHDHMGEEMMATQSYLMPATIGSTLTFSSPPINSEMQQQPIDLTELFVVSQSEGTPNNLHYSSSQQQQQQQQQHSDVSFASDRSTTDRGSLCLHHQVVQRLHQSPQEQVAANEQQTHFFPHHNAMKHNPEYLYLHDDNNSNNNPTNINGFISQAGSSEQQQDEDDNAMERMLKTCIGDKNKLRSSSSSSNLASLPIHQRGLATGGSMQSQKILQNGFNRNQQQVGSLNRLQHYHHNHQITGSDNNNSGEQDSSLNTNTSNTISSTTSSRTIKLPQNKCQRIPNGIGFILNDETTTTTSNKRL